jgi:uncharacterized protein (DUF4415 family)
MVTYDEEKRSVPDTVDWDKLVSDAPGEDREMTEDERRSWSDAFVTHSRDELRTELEKRRRGKGRKPAKCSVTVRYDADIIQAFKASGKGWQTLLNAAVRDWLKTHSPDDAVEVEP